ncbi:MAG: amino acid ABC transporter substrate-binding protein [Pseudomonadaceae bacterium]|nr:amino acid ABC transporter substrate-binding protein [Pseudomonadaceae bacterium]
MKQMLLALVVAVVASALTVWWLGKGDGPSAQRESAYERVMRTGVLRCGYASIPPALVVEPNTGEISGLDYEVVTALAAKLGLSVEWVEETGFGMTPLGLNGGKFDMFCTGNWIDSRKAKQVFATLPYYYNPVMVLVRVDDHRFDEDFRRINDESVVVAGIDNDPTIHIAEEDYPKAKLHVLPDIVSFAEAVEAMLAGKADVMFMPYWSGMDYMEKTPGKVRVIEDKPVRSFPMGFELPRDSELKYMLDVAMRELIVSGEVKALLKNYYGNDARQYMNVAAMVEAP